MPMYWTFNCFLGCIYTVYHIVYIVFLVLNWLSNLEFRLPKKEDQVAQIGVMGGGLGNSGNARKKTFFFSLKPSLNRLQAAQLSTSQSLSVECGPNQLGGSQVPQPTFSWHPDACQLGNPINLVAAIFFSLSFTAFQGCIFRLTCSHPELTKDHVLTSAFEHLKGQLWPRLGHVFPLFLPCPPRPSQRSVVTPRWSRFSIIEI